MKTFNVTITSRNKNSIYNFFLFFNRTSLRTLNAEIAYCQKNLKKKRLTVLKSPHVNKKAQEQFEYRLFKKQFRIKVTKLFKYLVFLKKLNYNLFSDIRIRLKHAITKKSITKSGLKIFNPNYCTLKRVHNFKKHFLTWKNLPPIQKKKRSKKKIKKDKHARKKRRVYLRSIQNRAACLFRVFDLYGESFKSLFE